MPAWRRPYMPLLGDLDVDVVVVDLLHEVVFVNDLM
jgi:hypothetical protein